MIAIQSHFSPIFNLIFRKINAPSQPFIFFNTNFNTDNELSILATYTDDSIRYKFLMKYEAFWLHIRLFKNQYEKSWPS